MIDLFINRIKDAYFDLNRDTARAGRFLEMSQAFTPGAIRPSPSQMPQQMSPETQQMSPEMQQPGPGMPAQPAPPEPSMLDLIGARR
jgi:hypothetical protein